MNDTTYLDICGLLVIFVKDTDLFVVGIKHCVDDNDYSCVPFQVKGLCLSLSNCNGIESNTDVCTFTLTFPTDGGSEVVDSDVTELILGKCACFISVCNHEV